MPRTVSLALRQDLFAQEGSEVIVALITIEHPDLPTPFRLCTDPTTRLSTDPLRYGITSGGDEYDFLPMAVILPEDSEDTPPAIRLQIDNIGRELVPLLRSTSEPADVTVELVRASAPNTIEVSYPSFQLSAADYNAQSVNLSLTIDALVSDSFPAGQFDPSRFKALY